jgi:hypothetical protein
MSTASELKIQTENIVATTDFRSLGMVFTELGHLAHDIAREINPEKKKELFESLRSEIRRIAKICK